MGRTDAWHIRNGKTGHVAITPTMARLEHDILVSLNYLERAKTPICWDSCQRLMFFQAEAHLLQPPTKSR